jgi:hypothetical protein
MILQQYLKHLAPHRRKAKTVSRTPGLGCSQRIAYAYAMVVLCKPQRAVRSM